MEPYIPSYFKFFESKRYPDEDLIKQYFGNNKNSESYKHKRDTFDTWYYPKMFSNVKAYNWILSHDRFKIKKI